MNRRALLGGALSGAALAGLTACGTDGAATATGSAGAGFPVTVRGKLGRTTVPARPGRVVAVGYLRDTDLAIGLGANLVGAVRNSVFASGLAPWQRPHGKPALLDAADGMPMERILALRPDLILAGDDYTLDTDNAKLTQIAPTLGYVHGAGQDDWTVMTRRAGRVLGRTDRAEKLIDGVRAKVAAAKKQHPGLAGKTFTFGPVDAGGQIYTISSTTDASARFFGQLGMTLSPKVTGLPRSSIPGRSEVSAERLDVIDADVLILTYSSEASRTELESDPLFRKLDAVRRGAYLALSMTTAVAVGFPSILSIPYGLDAVVPRLATAASR
jgi:ABC-type Fe3+-hydroxamate transport system substrate-binding protein